MKHIIFLSVQGAERMSFIPHAKIEKLIRASGIPYTFIRPSYFTDNLVKVFGDDIRQRDQLYIPAGNAKFLWVDVSDIGKAIAAVLTNARAHVNQAYTITGSKSELMTFSEVADVLSQELQRDIEYISPNPVSFFVTKKKEGVDVAFISVMFALHYVARFQKPPVVHRDLEHLIGGPPATVREYVQENLDNWQK